MAGRRRPSCSFIPFERFWLLLSLAFAFELFFLLDITNNNALVYTSACFLSVCLPFSSFRPDPNDLLLLPSKKLHNRFLILLILQPVALAIVHALWFTRSTRVLIIGLSVSSSPTTNAYTTVHVLGNMPIFVNESCLVTRTKPYVQQFFHSCTHDTIFSHGPRSSVSRVYSH